MTAAEAPNWHRGDWMQTFTGRQFYPRDPKADDVDPVDIAHALSMLCRYNGHVDRFYSVAEHCLLMSSVMPTPELALWALLHDATEAYVGDMVRPLKLGLPVFSAIEDKIMVEIGRRFDMPIYFDQAGWDLGEGVPLLKVLMPAEVKNADSRILLTERAALMSRHQSHRKWTQDGLEPLPVVIEALAPVVAEQRYLARLAELGAS